MYIFRADGNAEIGAGHLMRCLTMAGVLAEIQGHRENIVFVCADSRSAQLAERYNFRTYVLGTDFSRMEAEIPRWRQWDALRREEDHVILADSYYVTDEYLEELGKFGRVALMDDLGACCYPADCVINYNAPADRAVYERLYAGRQTRLVLGSAYVPVRKEFLQGGFLLRDQVKRVLITTGGGDRENIAGSILDAIYREDMEFFLVTGQFNPHFEKMKAREKTCSNIHILHSVENMAGLMEMCDMAVTAGGTTIYELAAVGVPFICFSYAENQEALTEYVGLWQIGGCGGAWHRDSEKTLSAIGDLFENLVSRKEQRQKFHEKETGLVDGKGAARLAEVLRSLSTEEV